MEVGLQAAGLEGEQLLIPSDDNKGKIIYMPEERGADTVVPHVIDMDVLVDTDNFLEQQQVHYVAD
jgi:hypothetical protein